MLIAFTVSGLRPKYLKQALESWRRARGIERASLYFSVEPAASFQLEDFRAYLRLAFPDRWEVIVRREQLGCLANTREAMRWALCDGGYAILAEEDLEVADDILEYFAWARDAYADDGNVAAVCAHARESAAGPADGGSVTRASWFSPLAWATWLDRWEDLICPSWDGIPGNAQGWDRNLQQVITGDGLCSVFPLLSRARHIGEYSTMHSPELGEMFYRSALSRCFAEHYPPWDYREVPYPEGKLWV